MTWYCVKETRDDFGHVTAQIVDAADSDEKPMDYADCTEDYDISYTWLGSMAEVEKFMWLLEGNQIKGNI